MKTSRKRQGEDGFDHDGVHADRRFFYAPHVCSAWEISLYEIGWGAGPFYFL
jgi:hypothetical protein